VRNATLGMAAFERSARCCGRQGERMCSSAAAGAVEFSTAVRVLDAAIGWCALISSARG
jgi:hypothetical protein